MKKEIKEIQTPLHKLHNDGKISQGMFGAGLQYVKDYRASIQDNMAKSKYDGVGMGNQNYSKHNKEPADYQLDAAKKINQIQSELNRRSFYSIPKKRHYNKRYALLVKAFLEVELGFTEVRDLYNLSSSTFLRRICESLEIIERFYRNYEKKK